MTEIATDYQLARIGAILFNVNRGKDVHPVKFDDFALLKLGGRDKEELNNPFEMRKEEVDKLKMVAMMGRVSRVGKVNGNGKNGVAVK